ncbi:Starch-binding associating with outer membrane [bacterium A37T11]|nr:Starch-binding associating with outer membrane [bacterium A37T11]
METILLSCSKTLNLSPEDTVSEADFFNDASDFELFANQFYYYMPTYNDDDQNSDVAMPISGVSSISNSSYIAPTSDNIWTTAYSQVWQTSYLIEKVNSASASVRAEISRYDGEARFFRAMQYFTLVKRFGDVPLIDTRLDVSDKEIIYKPRNSRKEVVNFILNQLDTAISELPLESGIALADKGRISKGSALAIKARVALFEATWRKFHETGDDPSELFTVAINACKEIFFSGEYQLFDKRSVMGDSSYRFFFILDKIASNPAGLTKADQKENIMVKDYDSEISAAPGVTTGPSPTKTMADMFLCIDGLPIDQSPKFKGYSLVASEYTNRDPRMTNDLLIPLQKYWSFGQPAYYRNWSNPTAGGLQYTVTFNSITQTGYARHKFSQEIQSPFSTNYPVIRLAEVYLIYAEATFELGSSISDVDLDLSINKLRERVGMPALTNLFVNTYGLDMRTEIRRERTVELLFEGFRFDDLRRWKTAETELSKSLKGIKFTGTQYATDSRWSSMNFTTDANGFIILEDASKRTFEQKNYLFPIPTRQIVLSPSLKQNPGWE